MSMDKNVNNCVLEGSVDLVTDESKVENSLATFSPCSDVYELEIESKIRTLDYFY